LHCVKFKKKELPEDEDDLGVLAPSYSTNPASPYSLSPTSSNDYNNKGLYKTTPKHFDFPPKE